jgi:hypothetical protein
MDNMELKTIEIHNAVPEYSDALNGWQFPRYPKAVRDAMSTRGRWISAKSTGVELRFVSDRPEFTITLTNPGEQTDVTVRRGSFWYTKLRLEAGQTRRFLVSRPPNFGEIKPEVLNSGGWSPVVWRIQFDNTDLLLNEIDPLGGSLRPPLAAEKPSLRWLAYGSSITNADLEGYPFIAAQNLRVDVMNKGMSGSCHIEKEAAGWLSSLDFDFATLELGINMRGEFDPEQFEERTRYLLKVMRAKRPKAPLVLITHFLNREHHLASEPTQAAQRQSAFDEILRRLHKEAQDPLLHLIEGTELLTEFGLLAADMIHPTHEGHAQMGTNLATLLRPLISQN